MLPIKPEVCIIDGKLNVFLGADYKAMPFEVADKFVRKLQRELATLRRQVKQEARGMR